MNLTYYLQQSGNESIESVCVLDTDNTPVVPMGASLAFVHARFDYHGIARTFNDTTAKSIVTLHLDRFQVHLRTNSVICFV